MDKKRAFQVIPFLMLVVSTITLVFNIYKWENDTNKEKASISVSGDFSYVPFSYD